MKVSANRGKWPLSCALKPLCRLYRSLQATCPAGVDVQGYISLIEKGLYNDAVALIKETNPLPAICGRVCVRPCETECRRNLLGEKTPVGIDYLKRFASDIDLQSATKFVPDVNPSTGKKGCHYRRWSRWLVCRLFPADTGSPGHIFEAAGQIRWLVEVRYS